MDLALFAQPNNAAFRAGMIVGIIFAVLICGSIPIAVGARKGQPVLGIVGGVLAGGISVFLGCLGGLPMALLFVLIIVLVSGRETTSRSKRRRYEYDDDDYDEDEEEDDYRPRRSRRDDYDDEDDYDRRSSRRRPDW